jgi:hypothetical protein
METPVRTINHRNFEIEIYHDSNNVNPSEDQNEDIFLVYDHKDFNIEVKGFKPIDIYRYLQIKEQLKLPFVELNHYNDLIEELKEYSEFDKYEIFTVFAYIHSGIALSLNTNNYPFNCRWDVSSSGFILVKKDIQWNNELEVVANSLIKEWNDCLSGNVYGFVINFDDQEIDAVWRFIGDIDKSGIIEDAKSHIDYRIRNNPEKYAEQLNLEI